MRFLGVLRFVLELTRCFRNILCPVALGDHVANLLATADIGQRHRVGAHVGDQADVALARQLDALVEFLCNAHRALRIEAELARRFLLQRRRRERRCRVAAALFLADAEDG